MRMKRNDATAVLLCLLIPLILSGCLSQHPPQPSQPAKVWGGIGASYEADKISGEKKGAATTAAHIGFEKRFGDGLGIGAEASGDAS